FRCFMKKQIFSTLFISILVIVGLGFVKYLQISKAIAEGAKHQPPPAAITTTVIAEQSWQKKLSSIGTLAPEQGIMIKVEEPGRVSKIFFESGQKVEKGQALLALDTSVEEANLSKAEAMEKRTKLALDRATKLFASKAVSQDEVDNWQAQYSQATAEARSFRAMIEKKVFKAPFSGQLGIRKVNLGEYVSTGADVISLQSYDKLYLNFSFPQQNIAEVKIGQNVELLVDAYPQDTFVAKITSINPEVEESTRNFLVQATFDNAEQKLKPGMFAKVSVNVGAPHNVIAIPSTSINYAPYGDSVYVIEKSQSPDGKEIHTAKPQFVEVGEKKGEMVAIIKGLSVGQEVATSGVFKLMPGAAVNINNSISPGNSLNPTPEDT
ncbi:MAG: efflux RND transporter periplasmic adaptor subunit, partial [Proteobacteria bacterium]|nr:efflux RND transporter periplasmic adaptor subunit [Pseudomonadota bacterium]